MIQPAELPGLRLAAPRVSEDDRRCLKCILEDAHGPLSAAQISERSSGLRWDDRKIRAIAEVCGWEVISGPGCPYVLWTFATIEDIEHADAAFDSQIRNMVKRRVSLNRALHEKRRLLPV